jgi:hypothetical protein
MQFGELIITFGSFPLSAKSNESRVALRADSFLSVSSKSLLCVAFALRGKRVLSSEIGFEFFLNITTQFVNDVRI